MFVDVKYLDLDHGLQGSIQKKSVLPFRHFYQKTCLNKNENVSIKKFHFSCVEWDNISSGERLQNIPLVYRKIRHVVGGGSFFVCWENELLRSKISEIPV